MEERHKTKAIQLFKTERLHPGIEGATAVFQELRR